MINPHISGETSPSQDVEKIDQLLKDIMKDMRMLWIDFLNFVDDYQPPIPYGANRSITYISINISNLADKDSDLIQRTIPQNIVYENELKNFLKMFSQFMKHCDYQIKTPTRLSTISISTQEKSLENLELLKGFFGDILITYHQLHDLLDIFLTNPIHKNKIDRLNNKITLHQLSDQPNKLDLSFVLTIFFDNIATTLQALQLLLGDAENLEISDLIARLNFCQTQTTSQPVIDPTTKKSYRLPISSLLGMLPFGSLAAASRHDYTLRQCPIGEIEHYLRKLNNLQFDHDKSWGGCLAITTIPTTIEHFFKLMAKLFPEKYEFNPDSGFSLKNTTLK